jgi:3-oxoacyl-[acyl-carrier-protein] synthase II
MDLYIHGTGIISAAGASGNDEFLNDQPTYNTDRLMGKEPNYTAYINPMQLRRMSKAVRMGIGASKIAMQDAGIEKPDALSIGTAMGCLQDTEVFLSKMVAQEEQMLTPTSFIQSTHNTVGGQIALLAGCYGHNLTYAHRGHSFEHAIINAQLYLNEHQGERMLVGGIDELTDSSVAVLKATGIYRNENSTEELLRTTSKGSIAGEGAVFFVASKEKAEHAIQVKGIKVFTTKDQNTAIDKLKAFLDEQGITPENIGLVMSGRSGDRRSNTFYDQIDGMFTTSSIAGFKHLCGEYATASSFGLGLVTTIAKNGAVPSFCLLKGRQPAQLSDILLVNHYMHYYSIWHLGVSK